MSDWNENDPGWARPVKILTERSDDLESMPPCHACGYRVFCQTNCSELIRRTAERAMKDGKREAIKRLRRLADEAETIAVLEGVPWKQAEADHYRAAMRLVDKMVDAVVAPAKGKRQVQPGFFDGVATGEHV